MKKTLLLTMLTILLSQFCMAQKFVKGNLKTFQFIRSLSIELNFDECQIQGLDQSQWDKYFNQDPELEKKECLNWQECCLKEITEELKECSGTIIDENGEGHQKAIIRFKTINAFGDQITEVEFFNANNPESFAIISFKGDGGRIGSPLNLILDGMEDMAENLGKTIRKINAYLIRR